MEQLDPATVPRQARFTDNPGAMGIVTTVFFMWGLITVLNDVLIPHLKAVFNLDYTRSMLVQFCFFSTYFVFAFPFGKLVQRFGYQKTMVTGLCTAGVGALLFLPAALAGSYPLFLGALIVVATGITGLQVSANPYVSVLGDPAAASSRLNLAQALNSLGTTIAPYLGGILILASVGTHRTPAQEAHSVIVPYLGLAVILFALAAGVALSKLPKMTPAARETGPAGNSIWRYRHTLLGTAGIFLYVGAEVSIGSFLVSYFSQPDIGGLSAQTAAKLVSLYWGGAMVGRFAGTFVLRAVKPGVVLGTAAIAAAALVAISMAVTGHVAIAAILLVGLCNSVMFPTIFALGIAELGPLIGVGSGMMIAAIVGGAIVPLAQGKLADRIGVHHAFILPAVCYLFIVYYGFFGSKPVRRAGGFNPAAG